MGVYLFGDLTVVNVSKVGLNTPNKAFVVHPTPVIKTSCWQTQQIQLGLKVPKIS